MPETPPNPAPDRPKKPLHRLAKPQPKAPDKPPEPDQAAGSGSATGFVSLLARRQFENQNSLEAAARRSRDQLRMAREIQPTSAQPTEPALPPPPKIPRWYPVAIFASFALALPLTAIGIWAIGALIYMHQVSPIAPRQVHYPLITWSLDVGTMGGYTPASRLMAWSMLACLPVAALLITIALILRRRLSTARQSQSPSQK